MNLLCLIKIMNPFSTIIKNKIFTNEDIDVVGK